MPRRHAPERAAARRGEAGFTLLETLIALVVASILSIGLVRFMASTHVIAGHADRKLAVAALETMVIGAIPPPNRLTSFQKSGSRAGLDWVMTGRLLAEDQRPAAAEALPAALDQPAGQDPAAVNRPPPDPAAGAENAEQAPTNDWRRYAITITISADGALLDQVELMRMGSAVAADAEAQP